MRRLLGKAKFDPSDLVRLMSVCEIETREDLFI